MVYKKYTYDKIMIFRKTKSNKNWNIYFLIGRAIDICAKNSCRLSASNDSFDTNLHQVPSPAAPCNCCVVFCIFFVNSWSNAAPDGPELQCPRHHPEHLLAADRRAVQSTGGRDLPPEQPLLRGTPAAVRKVAK